jgi:hypothetical protein
MTATDDWSKTGTNILEPELLAKIHSALERLFWSIDCTGPVQPRCD